MTNSNGDLRTHDSYNNYVHPLDEAAKQMYRNDPGFALRVEGLGYIAAMVFLGGCFALGFLIKLLG